MIRRKKPKEEIKDRPFTDIDLSIPEDFPEEDPLREKEEKTKKTDKVTDEPAEEDDPLVIEDEESGLDKLGEGKKISKKIIAVIAAGILALAVGIFFIVRNMDSGTEGKVYVESVKILAGLGSANGGTNRFTGEVEAQESWKITLESDLSVEECYVKAGDEVKKGDKLFKYNTEELKLNRERKELELETMQNENNQLSRDITTYQSDLKSASASEKIELQTQILTAQTTIKKNEFSIKSCKEEIEKIKGNIEEATVKSKMDGVVKKINTALGTSNNSDEETASDTENQEENSVYMTIQSVGDYRVKGKIKETNVSDLAEGDRVIVRSRVDDATWSGTVKDVKTDENIQENTSSDEYSYAYSEDNGAETASTYYFYVELDKMDGLLMGQHVFVELDNGQEDKEGIWISSAYVLAEDGAYYVWKDKKGHLDKTEVEIGEYDETLDEYQILSGISADDYIACDDIELKSGMKTTKVDPYSEDTDEEMEEGGEGGGMNPDGVYDDMEDESFDDSGMGDEGMSDESMGDEGMSPDEFDGGEEENPSGD